MKLPVYTSNLILLGAADVGIESSKTLAQNGFVTICANADEIARKLYKRSCLYTNTPELSLRLRLALCKRKEKKTSCLQSWQRLFFGRLLHNNGRLLDFAISAAVASR